MSHPGSDDDDERWTADCEPWEITEDGVLIENDGSLSFPWGRPPSIEPVSLPVRSVVLAAVRSGMGLDVSAPLPLNEPPILQLVRHLGLLDAYREQPFCLRCGLPGDTTFERWRVPGPLCALCIEHWQRSQYDPETGEHWTAAYTRRLEELKTDPEVRDRMYHDLDAIWPEGRPGRRRGSGTFESTKEFHDVVLMWMRSTIAQSRRVTEQEFAEYLEAEGIARVNDRQVRRWCKTFHLDWKTLLDKARSC